jgi:SAM-dependent methyltransferase
MPHNTLDFRQRARLVERMDEPCSREELRACLRDLARLNRWFLAYRPLLDWLNTIAPPPGEPLCILDVGCGYGDGLRRVEQWARGRGIAVELTGLDLNPDTVAIATEATPATSRIKWIGADVFAYTPPKPIHLVISSLFTHHLADADVIRFLLWMEQNAQLGWLINDLSRAAIPYHLLRIFSKAVGLHAFVQHDGPVSIARSFVAGDWQRMRVAAGLREQDVWIRGYAPARLCVGRSKRS